MANKALLYTLAALIAAASFAGYIVFGTLGPDGLQQKVPAATDAAAADEAPSQTTVDSQRADNEPSTVHNGRSSSDQDLAYALAGSSFAQEVSQGQQLCGSGAISFDPVGSDDQQTLTIYPSTSDDGTRMIGNTLEGSWAVNRGKLVLTNLHAVDSDGNPLPVKVKPTMIFKIDVDRGEAGATKMTETGSIRLNDGPILGYCNNH